MLTDIFRKYKFDKKTNRLGPDCPFTHWRLYFERLGKELCKAKFYHFAESASVRPGSYIINCDSISVGKRVVIRPSTMLFGDSRLLKSIIIEDDVLLGSGVHIYVSNHLFDDGSINIIDQGHSEPKPVLIREGAWIGANVTLLPGVEIGERSVVAAGSVVTKSFGSRVLIAGNPAREIKSL